MLNDFITLDQPRKLQKKNFEEKTSIPLFIWPIFFLPQGQLYNCIVQLKSKNIKTSLSNNVNFLVFILFYFRSILIILLCIKR